MAACHSGGSTPNKLCTKKSNVRRWPKRPPAPWSPPGTTSKSNFLLAFINAFTTCIVEDGSTLVSNSGTTNCNLPFKRYALSTFEDSAYSGPIGQPIHCSFHQVLSM